MMYGSAAILVFLALRISAETMQVELYRAGYRMTTGVISTTHVGSNMQCLHRCRRESECKGINMKTLDPDSILCEISNASIDDVGSILHLVKEEHWEFYKVFQPKKYVIKVESHAMLLSGTSIPTDLSYISINGKRFPMNKKGFWIISFDYNNGPANMQRHDVEVDDTDIHIPRILNDVKDGSVVVVGIADTAVESGTPLAQIVRDALKGIGAVHDDIGFRMAYCLVTMKGKSVSWKTEFLKRKDEGRSVCEVII